MVRTPSTTLCFKSCPHEGASAAEVPAHRKYRFQVMPPRGGIKSVYVPCWLSYAVSSHAPARGHQQAPNAASVAVTLFQVMPPRGGIFLLRSSMAHAFPFQVMPP